MSKIGKLPIEIPESVNVEIDGRKILVTGPKGQLELVLPKNLKAALEDGYLVVGNSEKGDSALHGTYRAHLANAVYGVDSGWKKELEIVGTGYRAQLNGDTLILTVGYSHPVEIKAPDGVVFGVVKNVISVEGVSKELVGQISALIRGVRPPEPYKGKGIKYSDEVVRRKAGKAAKAAA